MDSPSTWTSVWAITMANGIVFRQGVRAEERKGTGWVAVDGLPTTNPPASLSLDTQGRPWVLTTAGEVCVREDVWRENPIGTRWAILTQSGLPEGVRITAVSGGQYGQAWACTANGDIYARTGASPSTPFGLSWVPVKGSLTSIALSTDGSMLWGSNAGGTLFARTGITSSNPQGLQWAKLERPKDTQVRGVYLAETQALCLGKSGEVWIYSGNIREPKVESTTFSFFGGSGGEAVWHPLRWQAQSVTLNFQTIDIWVTTTTGNVIVLQRPDSMSRDAPLQTWASKVAMQQIAASGFVCVVAGASANHRVPCRAQSVSAPAPPPAFIASPFPPPQSVQQDAVQGMPAAYSPSAATSSQAVRPPPAVAAAGADAAKGRNHVLSGVPIVIAGKGKRQGVDYFVDLGRLPSPSAVASMEYSFEVERQVISRY